MHVDRTVTDKLLKIFSSLNLDEQIVLELLSVWYESLLVSKAVDIANESHKKNDVPRTRSVASWRKLFSKLRSLGMVDGSTSSVRCSRVIVEAITRHAERERRLDRHLQIVDEIRPPWKMEHFRYGRDVGYDAIFRNLRIAVHKNDVGLYNIILNHWTYSQVYVAPPFQWEERLFSTPFDKTWLLSRAPEIRDDAISGLVELAQHQLKPVDPLREVLNDTARDLEPPHLLRDLATHHAMLCGDFKLAEKLSGGDSTESGRLYRGWLCFVRGQRDEAITHFEAALQLTRKATGRRNVTLPRWAGALYVMVLLAAGDRTHLARAGKYLATAKRDFPSTDVYEVLRWVMLVSEGKVGSVKSAIENSKSLRISQEQPLIQLIIYVGLCWCNAAKERGRQRRISELENLSSRSGYRWLALEFSRVRNRESPDRRQLFLGAEATDDLGTVPLVDALPEVSTWERSLAALQRLRPKSSVEPPHRESESRLTWRVRVNPDPSIAAFEQWRGKTGKWTKGRAISNKRLHGRINLDFLSLQDIAVCGTIQTSTGIYSPDFDFDYGAAFKALIGHPLVFRLEKPSRKVEIVQMEPRLEVATAKGLVSMKLTPEIPASTDVLVQEQPGDRISVTVFDHRHSEIADILGPAGLRIPAAESHRIGPAIRSLSALVTVHSDLAAGAVDSTEVAADPTPQFVITPLQDGLRLEAVIQPLGADGPSFSPGQGGASVFSFIEGKSVRATRDLPDETRRLDAAVSACPSLSKASSDGRAWSVQDPVSSLEVLEELQRLGDSVRLVWPEGEKLTIRESVATDRLALKIRRRQDWFGIEGKIELDSGLVLTLRQLLDLMENSTGRFLELKHNEFLALTDRFRRRIQDLAGLVDTDAQALRMHGSRVHVLESIAEDAGSVDADAAWVKQIKAFREAQSLDPEVPSTLQAELRDYQVDGFKWAARLAAWGAGACLADDMGLGKTLQTLAVALSRTASGPILVVAPTSVCPNWIDEARRFAPTLNPVLFGRGNREEMLENAAPFDMVVCSYGLLHQEVDSPSKVHWSMIALDEAQAIKNRETMRSRAAMRLVGDFRIITTGTPIENHLGELHNLFSFINPGLLGSADSFAEQFASPIHQTGDHEAKARLKRLIQPFILRRTKSAVLDELPARTEVTLRVEMSPDERALYEALRQRAVAKLDGEAGAGSNKVGHIQVLAEITKLRRACCHPKLVMPDSGIAGSKLEAFLTTVEDLMENRHKALVFSQFVSHLDIVREELDRRGIEYRYLDGSTTSRKRKQEIDAFQAGQGSLFLISLRAGGQGLNLTAADYVVHLDPWWNPAVEDQASDRAHRIGQTRPVTIYRLVMKDSIEEKIVDLHRSKRDLADNLLAGTDMSGKMSADELLNLLREY